MPHFISHSDDLDKKAMNIKNHSSITIALILASGLCFAANNDPKTDPHKGPPTGALRANDKGTPKPQKEESVERQTTKKHGRSLRTFCREHSC